MKTRRAIVLALLVASCWLPAAGAVADDPDTPEDEQAGEVLAHFNDAETSPKRWITVNDNVMGGKSKGGPSFADGLLTFKGVTNTDGGGFSSIRTKPEAMNLTGSVGLLLRVKGDGRTYRASLRTDVSNGRWKIPFRAEFDTVKDEWVTVFVPYDAMTPTFWGREIKNDPPALELDKVQSMGLMIYDKKDGPFELQVDWIRTTKEAPTKSQ
jgi:monofunctional biosynthetic peptidoglycan transglycosylase